MVTVCGSLDLRFVCDFILVVGVLFSDACFWISVFCVSICLMFINSVASFFCR